jgi:hypothetical protein
MRSWKVAVVLAVISLLLAFALAAAQEPVRDFTQLNTRLRAGDTVWVTDAQGREVKGRIQTLSPDAVVLKGNGDRTFGATDVTTIRLRGIDTLRSGALIGLGVGAASGLALCAAAEASGPSDYAWCGAIFGAIGAGIGVGIDALTPGRKILAYRAPGAAGAPSARLSIAPVVTPRARGVAVSVVF